MKDQLPLPVYSETMSYEELREAYPATRLDGPRRKAGRSNIAVDDAFDLIGGVPRLAHWAHQNPGEFYTKIYAKTLQGAQQMEHSGEIVIRSAIPLSPLDGEFEDVTP